MVAAMSRVRSSVASLVCCNLFCLQVHMRGDVAIPTTEQRSFFLHATAHSRRGIGVRIA